MISEWLHDTASALAYSYCDPHNKGGDADLQPPYNEIMRFHC
jgi:hypothetical protein